MKKDPEYSRAPMGLWLGVVEVARLPEPERRQIVEGTWEPEPRVSLWTRVKHWLAYEGDANLNRR